MVVNKLPGGPKEGGEQSHVVSPEWEGGSMCVAAPCWSSSGRFQACHPQPLQNQYLSIWGQTQESLGWRHCAWAELLAAISATAVQPL